MKYLIAFLCFSGAALAQDSVMSYPPTWKINPDGSIGPVAARNVAIGTTVLNATGANLTSTDQTTPVNPASGKTSVYTKTGTLCALSPAGSETCTGSGGGGTWGSITGTLSSQTDLKACADQQLTIGQDGEPTCVQKPEAPKDAAK